MRIACLLIPDLPLRAELRAGNDFVQFVIRWNE